MVRDEHSILYLEWVEVSVVLPKDVTRHFFNNSNLLHSKLAFGVTLCVMQRDTQNEEYIYI